MYKIFPPLLCIIDEQQMDLNIITEKSISSSQQSSAAIHRWSIRHNDGRDYSEAKSDKSPYSTQASQSFIFVKTFDRSIVYIFRLLVLLRY